MPARNALALVVFLLLAALSSPRSQDASEDTDWIRLESAQVGRSPQEQTEVHILHAQTLSGRRPLQLAALSRIRALVEANDPVSRYPEVTEIISLLVLEPHRVERAGTGTGDESAAPAGHPEVRLEAIELLSRIGGRQAYEILAELVRLEDDDTVRAAAFRALPRLGVRPDADMPALLAGALRRSYGNEPALEAALTAVRALHERYGFMDVPQLFTEVIEVAQGPYSRRLRRQAFEVVELLRE